MTIEDREKHIELMTRQLQFLYKLTEQRLDWDTQVELSLHLIKVYSHIRKQEWVLGLDKERERKKSLNQG